MPATLWICLVEGQAPAGAEMRIRAWTSDPKRAEAFREEGLEMQEFNAAAPLRAALQEIDEIGRKITDLKNEHGIRMGNIAHAALLGVGGGAQASPEQTLREAIRVALKIVGEPASGHKMMSSRREAFAVHGILTKALAVPSASRGTEALTTCERCQGNGEIVLDWETYLHPANLLAEEGSVTECPDCNGEGRTSQISSTKGESHD